MEERLENFCLLRKGVKTDKKGSIIPPPPDEKISLNPKTLGKVLDETEWVKGVLHSIFADDEKPEPPVTQSCVTGTHSQLPPELESFLQHILTKDNWMRKELHKMALEKKIMLDSAVEEINFWCEEQTGDYLIYENQDSYIVQRELLGNG